MQPELQPLKEFLLKLIYLHILEHMKRDFSFNGGPKAIMQPPVGVNGNRGQQVQQVPQHPFRQPTPIPNLSAIKEVVQELYGPSLRQIGSPKFYKPYP